MKIAMFSFYKKKYINNPEAYYHFKAIVQTLGREKTKKVHNTAWV